MIEEVVAAPAVVHEDHDRDGQTPECIQRPEKKKYLKPDKFV